MAPPKKRKPQPVGVASVQRSNKPLVIIIGAVVTLLVAVAVILAVAGDNNDEAAGGGRTLAEWQPVTLTGTSLAAFSSDSGAADATIGTPAPVINGENFAGEPVAVANDGRAKAIMFFAHWCPHCQREAPVLASWINDNASDYPNVDFYAVATGTEASRANFPPSAWLNKLDFPAKIIADDQKSSAATAYGLSSYPYIVFVGADGNVVQRVSGALGGDVFGQYVANVSGAPGVTPTTSAADAAESTPVD